jgi:hypothetical protein
VDLHFMARSSLLTRLVTVVLLGIAAHGTTRIALADEGADAAATAKVEEAQKHFRRGKELYEENNFRGALVEMQRAYEISGNYRLLFDLGQIHYQLQDYPSAMSSFTRYLAAGRAEIPQARIDDVQKDIERLKGRIGTLRITSSKAGAQILVDDVPAGTAPLSEPVVVGAGRHKITATFEGQTTAPKVIDVAGTDSVDVSLAFVEAAAPKGGDTTAKPPGDTVEAPRRAPVWVPWTITGGLLVATAATGIVALGKSSQLNTDLGTAGITRPQIDDAASATKTTALVTDVLLAATLVGAGTSLAITIVSRPRRTTTGRSRWGTPPSARSTTPELSALFGIGSVRLGGVF